MSAMIVLSTLLATMFFPATSLALPTKLNSKVSAKDGLELLEGMSAMPGLDPKLLAMDLSEMELEPSGVLLTLADMAPNASEVSEAKFSRNRPKPMMWVHIHKAGGSFMCAAAHLNKEKVVKGGNCNWGPDGGQGAHYLRHQHTSCKERNKHFGGNNYTWGQIEQVLDDEFCFDTFDYGIWLRDPVKLALSEANYKYFAKDVEKNLACATREFKKGENPQTICPDPIDDVPLWKYFDNYVVRVLGGPKVYNLQPGKVTEEHAKAAMQLLSKFKVRVSMDNVVQSKEAQEDFLQELGWHEWPATDDFKTRQGLRMEKSKAKKRKSMITFSLAEELKIREQNKYDYMLYEYVSKNA